jgi:hypothetical protein
VSIGKVCRSSAHSLGDMSPSLFVDSCLQKESEGKRREGFKPSVKTPPTLGL